MNIGCLGLFYLLDNKTEGLGSYEFLKFYENVLQKGTLL